MDSTSSYIHPDLVKALPAAGADVNAKNNKGETALILASQIGTVDVIQALQAKGADVNAKTADGKTAIDSAKKGGHDEIEAVLTQAGAK